MSRDDAEIIHCRIERGIRIVNVMLSELHGDEVTDALLTELFQTLDGVSNPRVVLDLGNVQYVNSMGTAALLKLRKSICDHGGRLVLSNLTRRVSEVLYATKVATHDPHTTSLLYVLPGVSDALDELSRSVSS